jgi:hypothetical protein
VIPKKGEENDPNELNVLVVSNAKLRKKLYTIRDQKLKGFCLKVASLGWRTYFIEAAREDSTRLRRYRLR